MTKIKLAGNLPPFIYKLMIVLATLIWGSTFVVMKDALQVLSPSWLLGVRFLITFVIFFVIFHKKIISSMSKKLFLAGVVLGLLDFGSYWFQTVGLVYTTPGKNAFLTDVYCVLVPFIYWLVARKKPTIFNIVAALVCIVGVGFVSLSNDTFSIGFGDMMTIVCGVLFSFHIVAASILSKKHDILIMTVIQFLISGMLGVITGIVTEPLPSIQNMTPAFVCALMYLVIFGSCIAMGFQNISLAHVPPSQAAILLSLESVFGVIFSVIFYGEVLTLPLVIGFILIFASILLSEAFPRKKPPEEIDEALVEDAGVIE